MRKLLFLGCVAGCLSSCSSVESYPLPDGRTAHVVSCDGNWSSIADCYKAAAEMCPSGKYEVLKRSDATGVVGDGDVIASKPLRSVEFTCPA